MEGSGELFLCSAEGKECFPESRGEDGTTIGNDVFREAMELDDSVYEVPGNLRGIVGGLVGAKMNHLRKAVNEDDDGIVSTRGDRKLGDEVHGEGLPRFLWDWERLQKSCRELISWLVSLAGIAWFNILLDVFRHAGPEEVTSQGIVKDGVGWMSTKRSVMIVV
jgi:hypothetical protein